MLGFIKHCCTPAQQEELRKALDPTSAEQIIAFEVELPRFGSDTEPGEDLRLAISLLQCSTCVAISHLHVLYVPHVA